MPISKSAGFQMMRSSSEQSVVFHAHDSIAEEYSVQTPSPALSLASQLSILRQPATSTASPSLNAVQFISCVPKTRATEMFFSKRDWRTTYLREDFVSPCSAACKRCCCGSNSDCAHCKQSPLLEQVSTRHLLQLRSIISETAAHVVKTPDAVAPLQLLALALDDLGFLVADSPNYCRMCVYGKPDEPSRGSLIGDLLPLFTLPHTETSVLARQCCTASALQFLCVVCAGSRDCCFEALRETRYVSTLLDVCKAAPCTPFPFYAGKPLQKKKRLLPFYAEYLVDAAECPRCMCCRVRKVRSSPLALCKYAAKLLSIFLGTWYQASIGIVAQQGVRTLLGCLDWMLQTLEKEAAALEKERKRTPKHTAHGGASGEPARVTAVRAACGGAPLAVEYIDHSGASLPTLCPAAATPPHAAAALQRSQTVMPAGRTPKLRLPKNKSETLLSQYNTDDSSDKADSFPAESPDLYFRGIILNNEQSLHFTSSSSPFLSLSPFFFFLFFCLSYLII